MRKILLILSELDLASMMKVRIIWILNLYYLCFNWNIKYSPWKVWRLYYRWCRYVYRSIDATFSTCPPPFYQLLTITFIRNRIDVQKLFPAIYILMSHKDTNIYKRILIWWKIILNLENYYLILINPYKYIFMIDSIFNML